MNIIIAGGSGYVGQAVAAELKKNEHHVTILTRQAEYDNSLVDKTVQWDGKKLDYDDKVDIIINLCGKPITDHRWTNKIKIQLLKSRIEPTQAIVNFIANYREKTKPRLINASAIGYYPSSQKKQTETEYQKNNPSTFSFDMVKQWESVANSASSLKSHVCILRLGVVLGKNSPFMRKILPPYQLGLGAIIGNPEAHLSWIHIDDVVQIISRVVEQPTREHIINLVSNSPCTQTEFATALAQACGKPRFLTVPSCVIQLAFGELGKQVILADQKIYSTQYSELGVQLAYESIQQAMIAITN